MGNLRLASIALAGFIASVAGPVSAQTVAASTSIPGNTYEFYTQYYNNSSVRWVNETPTIYNGVVSPVRTASLVSDTAEAYAIANISDGKTYSYALAGDGSFANAISGFNDTLNFTIAGANASTVTQIHVITTLHTSSPYFDEAGITTNFGDASVGYVFDGTLDDVTWSNMQTGNYLDDYLTYSDGYTRTFDMTYDLVGDSQSLGYLVSLSALSQNWVTTDLMGDVRFVLPSNVSFTSTSGAFLTSVPEPASWATMLGGFGMIGSAMRGRRRAAVRIA